MIASEHLKQLEKTTAILVKQAGNMIMQAWSDLHVINYTDGGDRITNIDLGIEEFLRNELHKILPEAGFIVEEGKTQTAPIYNWIIDPIDQTKNYAAQLPLFFTQIGLLENNEPLLSHIYNPLSNQLFSASKGNGAYLNGKQVTMAEARNIDKAVLDIDLGGNDKYLEKNLAFISNLMKTFYRVRVTGGAYPVYLTTEAIDGYIVLNSTTKIVDQLPRICIMREAGIRSEYIRVGDREILIAANNNIFSIIEEILKKSYV